MEPIQPAPAPYTPPVAPTPTPVASASGMSTTSIGGAFIILAVVAFGAYSMSQKGDELAASPTPKPAACTKEARMCPDGSSVARTGPACEFAPCPEPTSSVPAGWKTYTNAEYGFEFQYPTEWTGGVNNNYTDFAVGFGPGLASDAPVGVEVLVRAQKPGETLASIQQKNGAYMTWRPAPQYIGGQPAVIGISAEFAKSFGYTIYKGNVYTLHNEGVSNPKILSTFKFTSSTSTVPADWKIFSSKYFTLSFKVPPGYVVTDGDNNISIFHGSPPTTETAEFPAKNRVIYLQRYQPAGPDKQDWTSMYNPCTAVKTIIVADTTFPAYEGKMQSSGGCQYSPTTLTVLFDASAFHAIESDSMSISLAKQILSTFRFSKDAYNTSSLSVPATPQSSPLLLRIMGGEKIWEISNGTRYLLSFNEFQAKGYAFGQVKDVTRANLFQYAPHFQLITLGTSSDSRVWEVTKTGMLHLIPNPSIFSAYGFSWDNVQNVDGHTYNQFTRAALYRLSGDERVWYLEPNGSRRLIATTQLFNQLGCDPEKVVTVISDDLALYWEGAPLTPEDVGWACKDASTSRTNQI